MGFEKPQLILLSHRVTTGLDPVVHADVRLSMDARVKPGHDERENDKLQ
jgi:hypothetical protein